MDSFSAHLAAANNSTECNKVLAQFLKHKEVSTYSFTYYAYHPHSANKLKFDMCSDNFKHWHQYYLAQQYNNIDSTLSFVYQNHLPIYWNLKQQLLQASTDEECQMREDSMAFGAEEGLSIPVHGPQNNFAILLLVQIQNQNCRPHAQLWKEAVNWTTVMAYDHYGTFGLKTELGSALYETGRPSEDSYLYPTTSGDIAVRHYHQQGLKAKQILLGVPFYCHSYYVNNAQINWGDSAKGLHVPVFDPNISSQVDYQTAFSTYGEKLFTQSAPAHPVANYYGLIPVPGTQMSRFLSCDSPQSIRDKINYVQGNNPLSKHAQKNMALGGVSFWSLQQDLPFSHAYSLLNAIDSNLTKHQQ